MSSEPEFDDDPILLPLFGGGAAANGQARTGRVRSTFKLNLGADDAPSSTAHDEEQGMDGATPVSLLRCFGVAVPAASPGARLGSGGLG